MAAAQAKARAMLPTFWKSFALPGPGEERFAVKVAFPTNGNNSEAIWVNTLESLGNARFRGRLANQPRDMQGKNQVDTVEFGEAQILDWSFMRNGKIVGNETMRPLLDRLPKAEADKYRAMLEAP